jgi:hypothetical protein
MTKTPLPPPLSEPITLSNLEFVVITLQVICPEGVTNEVDLLSCIDRIHVTGWRMNPYEREAREKEGEREGAAEREGTDEALSLGCKESNAFAFEVPVDDEERIWSAYETAPGGVILLREATLMRDRGTWAIGRREKQVIIIRRSFGEDEPSQRERQSQVKRLEARERGDCYFCSIPMGIP